MALLSGIDSFAHEECINSGGKTIAIIASGFNNIYPDENRYLYEKILKSNGCIISEYSPKTEINMKRFPIRNRLISGISIGTLVIEASYRSGTGITARLCIEQNRKLFCIPNSIGNKNSIGVNELIKKGAILVTSTEDIIKEIGKIENKVKIEKIRIEGNSSMVKKNLSNLELKIYNFLVEKPKSADEISNITKLEVSKINAILSMLEIEDYILKLSNNKYMVKNNE